MIEITAQIKYSNGMRYLIPHSDDDQKSIENLHLNQLVKVRITSITAVKQRSLVQLNLLMKACDFVSKNTEDPSWDTKEKVKIQIKEKADYKDYSRAVCLPNGFTYVPYRSFAFLNLKHMEACRVFDIGFGYMSDFLGYDHVDNFISAVKQSMGVK